MSLGDAVEFITEYKRANRAADKARVEDAFVERFRPERRRKLLICSDFSVRFSEANTGSFSNTVLSLSALQAIDSRPLLISLVRPNRVEFFLANSTFLKKISHSSHQLRVNNIKGSFNGTDILTEFEGIPNEPSHFDELFAAHSAFTWEENVERLVQATHRIVGRDLRFRPSLTDRALILSAPERAAEAMSFDAISEIEGQLNERVHRNKPAILSAARAENVNLRGNAIEQIITGGVNVHELGDLEFIPRPGTRLLVDVKTKLLDRASAPKAYNIDKFLSALAQPAIVLAFYFIGVDLSAGTVSTRLVSVFDPVILEATRVQFHWAGRNSRGVTQLTGGIRKIFEANYHKTVAIQTAKSLLSRMLDI